MTLKIADLKNPVKIKTFGNCSLVTKHLNDNNYFRAKRLIKYLTSDTNIGGLNYDIAYELTNDKILIYCEKEKKKEISAAIKKWLSY